MGERLKNYLKEMERLLTELERDGKEDGGPQVGSAREEGGQARRAQLQRAKGELLVQIGFFQHERLVHLMVTALFALLALIVLIWAKADFSPESALLFLLLFVLLIPYIRHYYILENGTQKLYQYYDRLEALLEEIP